MNVIRPSFSKELLQNNVNTRGEHDGQHFKNRSEIHTDRHDARGEQTKRRSKKKRSLTRKLFIQYEAEKK